MGVVWPQGGGSTGIEGMTSLYMKVWNSGYMCWTSIGRSVEGLGVNVGGRPVIWACATPSFGNPVVAFAEEISGGDAYTYFPVVRQYVADSDGDGLSDALETQHGLDSNSADSDGDGLSDGDEWLLYGTVATNEDTDADGVLDGEEIWGLGYVGNPLSTDSDGDGIGDAADLFLNSADSDQDGDGILDENDEDADNDGVLNTDETMTNPFNPDSNSNGIPDGLEGISDTTPPVIVIIEPQDGVTL